MFDLPKLTREQIRALPRKEGWLRGLHKRINVLETRLQENPAKMATAAFEGEFDWVMDYAREIYDGRIEIEELKQILEKNGGPKYPERSTDNS